MTKVFVSWGWDLEDSKTFDSYFLASLKGKKIGYVPWAMPESRYKACLERIEGFLPKQDGFDVLCLDEKINYLSQKDLLQTLDAIYIGWGNTYRLMSLCRQNLFLHFLEIFVKLDKPIYWGSAWAILFGKSIHSAPDANITNLNEKESYWLGLFSNISFFCHYKTKNDWEILDYINSHKNPVIALPEGGWLVLQDWKYSVHGSFNVYLFLPWEEKQELCVWEGFTL